MSSPPRPFHRLWSDCSGTSPERWALIAGGIVIACVMGARVADTATKATVLAAHDAHRLARSAPEPSLTSQLDAGNVDYSATASIPSPNVHLDPCTGQTR